MTFNAKDEVDGSTDEFEYPGVETVEYDSAAKLKRTKSQVEREQEKTSKFWDSFATTYSLIYGIFLIIMI